MIAFLAALALGPGSVAADSVVVTGTLRSGRFRVADAVVYLVPLDPGESAPMGDTVIIDQRDLRFLPRVLPVRPGATVEFRNSDPVLHNVFSPRGVGPGFDLGTYPRTDQRPHTFLEPGTHVILCHLHPEMVAYVVVVGTPFYTVVDDDGRFSLTAPPGRYLLRVWHRRAAPFERTVQARGATLDLQELELEPAGSGRRR